MSIELNVSSDALPAEELDRFVRGLNVAIAETGAAQSELATLPSQAGEKGAATVLGKILLEVVSSSAAGELIKVIGAYFNREKSVVGEISFPDGTVIKLDAKNLNSAEVESALASMMARKAAG